MVVSRTEPHSRRELLRMTMGIAGACAFSATLQAEEPFDSLPAAVLKNARRNGLVMIHHPAPPSLSARATIVSADEPGERLVAAGQVFAPDGLTPASGVTVYAYNTDAQGYYGANQAEYPPRIYGWMKADAAGRFELHTLRPGSYPGMQVPRHIHFSFWGAGYPLQWSEELRFEGDPYLTAEALAEDRRRGEFRSIRKLTRGEDQAFHCSVKIKLLRQSNFR